MSPLLADDVTNHGEVAPSHAEKYSFHAVLHDFEPVPVDVPSSASLPEPGAAAPPTRPQIAGRPEPSGTRPLRVPEPKSSSSDLTFKSGAIHDRNTRPVPTRVN